MALLFRCGFRDLPALMRAEQLDVLVVDRRTTLAERLGLRFVSLANALLVNREPLTAADAAYAPLLEVVNAQREAWGCRHTAT